MNAVLPAQTVGAGRFLLKRILGQGGMGVVWLAEDKLLGEPVALKFLPPQLSCDPAGLDSLRTETLRSRKLSHPNILRIHDLVDAPDETVFISMEYVDGPNLHAFRASQPEKVLGWSFLEPLVRQLCAALEYAHGEKVIHRDLKPPNLMLDANGRLKLADFGLARVITDSVSRISGLGQTSGTLMYMSPQQADGKTPRVTDDIYSVGTTLYELLTSTPPFYQGDVGHQARNNQPQPINERLAELRLSNDIPETVSALVMSCLAKDPEQRPQNARELLDSLNMEGGATASPTSPKRTAPRRSRWLLKAAALAALVIGITIWATLRPSPNLEGRATASPTTASPTGTSPIEPGFESIFNGRDLTGWDCEPNLWTVQDGAITAFTAEEGVTRKENTCLIWKGTATDFVLRLSFRLRDVITEKPANSGVLYRSRRVQNWQVRGYQCDLHGPHTGSLILLEDDNDPRSTWGHSVVIRPTSRRPILESKGAVTDPARFKDTIKFGEWNELEITAQGKRITHKINGVVTMEARDDTLSSGSAPGLLAIELKRATNLQFKNIRLKRLTDAQEPAGE
jgi:serine/threonine protein kinase